jgi:hypothetical protein
MAKLRQFMKNVSAGANSWRLPTEWKFALAVWLATRLALTLLGGLLFFNSLPFVESNQKYYYNIQPVTYRAEGPLLGIWQRWDGIHYQRIAEYGYYTEDLSAFFPLYPLLARQISALTGFTSLASLLLLSNLAYLFCLVLLYQIVREKIAPEMAQTVVVCAAIFPTAFFFFAPYPMSTGLMFVLLAYRSAYQRRWFLASLAGLCAGLTHPTILPLFVLLLWEVIAFLRQHPPKSAWILTMMPFLPLSGMAFFLAFRSIAGFPEFSTTQTSSWGRTFQAPWQFLLDIPRLIQNPSFLVSGWLNLVLVFLAVAATIWAFRRISFGLWLYMLALLLFLLATGINLEPLASFNRFVLLLFPLFITLGMWSKNRILRPILFVSELLLFLYFSTLYFLWLWVG